MTGFSSEKKNYDDLLLTPKSTIFQSSDRFTLLGSTEDQDTCLLDIKIMIVFMTCYYFGTRIDLTVPDSLSLAY